MRVTEERSEHFDEALIVHPDKRGNVAWSQFNQHYHVLQTTKWSHINRGRSYPWYRRLVRLGMAWVIQRSDAILDLRGKARWFWKMPIPKDPDIVFFGAEVGWEASLLQALYGSGGRVVLIDNDPEAYQRFQDAPTELRVRAPRGFGSRELIIERDLDRIEYVREDLFDWRDDHAFDVGIDWGLIEHFTSPRKLALMETMQRFLRPDGVQISAVPRNTRMTRAYYWAFRDELNFGYRELMNPRELRELLEKGGYRAGKVMTSPSTCVACSRVG
jgi:SAM-dependent methyltransferase